jgi:ParB family chromosome partitioning protein
MMRPAGAGGPAASLAAPAGDDAAGGPRVLDISRLQPGKYQPRRRFDAEDLDALVASIRTKGVLQPLLVRPLADGRFEIVAGERRWRAAQTAQLHEVPVVIRDLTDRDALEIALVENIQRADLSPLEEAEGYRRLIEEFAHTQEDLAKAVGKSRSHVANMLRLLALPDGVRVLVEDGKLTAGHARALLTVPDPQALAEKTVAQGLSVRQVEKLAQDAKAAPAEPKSAKPRLRPASYADGSKDPDTVNLERQLGEILGLRTFIEFDGRGAGFVTIQYDSLEQLDDLTHRLQAAAGHTG